MKLGSIIRNDWAGENNPSKYFVYTGIVGKYATGIYFDGKKLAEAKYYAVDFVDSGKFVEVDYCGYQRMIIDALDSAKANDALAPEINGFEGTKDALNNLSILSIRRRKHEYVSW